jgi:hypothetical protein
MKHASAAALAKLQVVIDELRTLPQLTERKLGTFYLRSSAFLHFHEGPAGLFADVKLDLRSFERMPVNTRSEMAALLMAVRSVLPGAALPRRAQNLSGQ